jgi:hypothetical protein
MLGELIRETAIGATMQASHIAFDDSPGAQLQPVKSSQRVRLKEWADRMSGSRHLLALRYAA